MADILHFEILRKHGQTNTQTNTQTNKHTNKHTNKQTWALQYLALPLWGRGNYGIAKSKFPITIMHRYYYDTDYCFSAFSLKFRCALSSPMALSKAANDLDELVECPICLEHFTDPRSLPCLHSFCVQCLDQAQKAKESAFPAKKGYIECPTCNDKSKLPKGSVLKLRRYFVAGKVTAVVKDLQNAQEQENMMNICRRCRMKNNSVSYCFDCAMPMCDDCLLKHNQRTANEAHMAITVTAKTISVLICKLHREFVEDFCSQCFTFACSTCHKTVHKGHKFRSFTMQRDAHNANFLQKIDKEVKNIDILLQSVAQIKDDSYMLVSAQMKRLSIMQRSSLETFIRGPHQQLKSKINMITSSLDEQGKVLTKKRKQASDVMSLLNDIPGLGISGMHNLIMGHTDKICQIGLDVKEIFVVPRFRINFLPNRNVITLQDGKLHHYDKRGRKGPIPFSFIHIWYLLMIGYYMPRLVIKTWSHLMVDGVKDQAHLIFDTLDNLLYNRFALILSLILAASFFTSLSYCASWAQFIFLLIPLAIVSLLVYFMPRPDKPKVNVNRTKPLHKHVYRKHLLRRDQMF